MAYKEGNRAAQEIDAEKNKTLEAEGNFTIEWESMEFI